MTPQLTDDDTLRLRLILRLDSRTAHMVILPPGRDAAPSAAKTFACEFSLNGIKSLVYDNPELLGDFESTDLIFATREFFTAPEGTDELIEAMAEAMLPDYDTDRTLLRDGIICYALPSELHNFLTRTFACARFHHCLSLCADRLTEPGVYALADGDGLTLLRLTDRLEYLNRLPAVAPADCAYYILAVAQADDPVFLSADSAEEITALIAQVNPNAKILPLSLCEPLVKLRQQTGAPLDTLFL
ncbi:MAG: DUF3822 family protein [Bacteroides sp.]|nr:DUF3822 family protein [Bacteroides sp.]MCM1379112.1 DUF3822 family protein [Bacteroides sp.]MCM1445810.1 DUF3822 family protein [Prevotella sp.]